MLLCQKKYPNLYSASTTDEKGKLESLEELEEWVAKESGIPSSKHGAKRLQVNCFLDECSDMTCVNEDAVEELGMEGPKEKVTINVANDQKVDLMSATMEIELESLDG